MLAVAQVTAQRFDGLLLVGAKDHFCTSFRNRSSSLRFAMHCRFKLALSLISKSRDAVVALSPAVAVASSFRSPATSIRNSAITALAVVRSSSGSFASAIASRSAVFSASSSALRPVNASRAPRRSSISASRAS